MGKVWGIVKSTRENFPRKVKETRKPWPKTEPLDHLGEHHENHTIPLGLAHRHLHHCPLRVVDDRRDQNPAVEAENETGGFTAGFLRLILQNRLGDEGCFLTATP